MLGGPRVDRLRGGPGDDHLVGGPGTDTAVFSALQSEYSVSVDDAGTPLDPSDDMLPVNKMGESGMGIRRQLPTYVFTKDVLKNPFYAGTYVRGRRPMEKVVVDGQIRKRQGSPREPEDSRVFIRDHHEGYTTWQTYEENRRIMRANALNLTRDESVGPARAGQGILAGLLRCGRCGRKLHVRYWGKSGTAACYVCNGEFAAGGNYCLGFGGSTVDRRFSKDLLAVITPLGVEANLEPARKMDVKRDERYAVVGRQLEELEYEQRRAF